MRESECVGDAAEGQGYDESKPHSSVNVHPA